MIPKAYAHSLPGKSKEWQPLDEHLKAVAEKAKDFAGNIRIESAQVEDYAFYRCWQAFVRYQRRPVFDMTLLAHPGHALVKRMQ